MRYHHLPPPFSMLLPQARADHDFTHMVTRDHLNKLEVVAVVAFPVDQNHLGQKMNQHLRLPLNHLERSLRLIQKIKIM